MSKEESLFPSLATSGAALVTFVGVCHEVVGARVFPWAPAVLGGPIGWHGVGVGTIVIGLLLLGGTLRLIRFPVFPWALAVAATGVGVVLFTAVTHREFHLFAFTVVLAATGTALFHRKALQLAAVQGASRR